MIEKVHAIQDAGMEVWCGMILGFDHDDETIFDAQLQFIARGADRQRSCSACCTAIPKTPLLRPARRRGAARHVGRDRSSAPTSSRCGSAARSCATATCGVLARAVRSRGYFDRMEALFLDANLDFSRGANRHWRRHPWRRARAEGLFLAQALGLLARLAWRVPDPALRREYFRRVGRIVKVRRDPAVLWIVLVKCVMHYHAHTMARRMSEGLAPVVNSF